MAIILEMQPMLGHDADIDYVNVGDNIVQRNACEYRCGEQPV